MNYNVEDISAVQKKVTVTVTPEEVNGAIAVELKAYENARLPGYRQGKVPASVIEQRFKEQIYKAVQQNLINVHLGSIVSQLDVQPIAGFRFADEGHVARDKDFVFVFTFEYVPALDLPNYEGIEVISPKPHVFTPEERQTYLERSHATFAEYVEVTEGPAQDQDMVTVDFKTYRNNRIDNRFCANEMDMFIGLGQSLPDFDTLVKKAPIGVWTEGNVTFPKGFLAKDLDEETVLMRVRVRAIKRIHLEELTDKFLITKGFKGLEDFKAKMAAKQDREYDQFIQNRIAEALTQKLLKMVDFPVPETLFQLIEFEKLNIYVNERERKGFRVTEKDLVQVKERIKNSIELEARELVLLMAIAKREDLKVTDQEVQESINNLAAANNIDYNELRKQYENNGYYFLIYDRFLAERAQNLIYARANIKPYEAPKETVAPQPKQEEIHYYQPEQTNEEPKANPEAETQDSPTSAPENNNNQQV